MSARGLLENPSLFAGPDRTPWHVVDEFIGLAVRNPLPYGLVQYHVTEMTSRVLTRPDRQSLQRASNLLDLIDWVNARAEPRPPRASVEDKILQH